MRTIIERGLDEDGEEVEISVPVEWAICDNCHGEGSFLDYETACERGDDIAPMTRCPVCSGRGSMLTPLHEKLTEGERDAIEARWSVDADCEAEARAEAAYFGW